MFWFTVFESFFPVAGLPRNLRVFLGGRYGLSPTSRTLPNFMISIKPVILITFFYEALRVLLLSKHIIALTKCIPIWTYWGQKSTSQCPKLTNLTYLPNSSSWLGNQLIDQTFLIYLIHDWLTFDYRYNLCSKYF